MGAAAAGAPVIRWATALSPPARLARGGRDGVGGAASAAARSTQARRHVLPALRSGDSLSMTRAADWPPVVPLQSLLRVPLRHHLVFAVRLAGAGTAECG